jgi:hypothetical protein
MLLSLLVVAACGNQSPALQNAPRPDPNVVAGAAAAVAGAATIADPQAAKKAEKREAEARKGGAADLRTRKTPTMPADVFDRMEEAESSTVDAGVDAPADAAQNFMGI